MHGKRLLGPAIVGLLGLVVGCMFGGGPSQPEVQAQAPKKGPAWEYCELSAVDEAEGLKSQFSYSFDTGEKGVEERSWEELAKKMGVRDPKGGMNAIWDHLGSQGWEMVAAYSAPNVRRDGGIFSVDEYWLFKRSRP